MKTKLMLAILLLAGTALAQPKCWNFAGLTVATGTLTLSQEGLPQASATIVLPLECKWDANYTVSFTRTDYLQDYYGGELYVAYQDENGFVVEDTCTLEDSNTFTYTVIDVHPAPFFGMEK
jgi:hypothetical protein